MLTPPSTAAWIPTGEGWNRSRCSGMGFAQPLGVKRQHASSASGIRPRPRGGVRPPARATRVRIGREKARGDIRAISAAPGCVEFAMTPGKSVSTSSAPCSWQIMITASPSHDGFTPAGTGRDRRGRTIARPVLVWAGETAAVMSRWHRSPEKLEENSCAAEPCSPQRP